MRESTTNEIIKYCKDYCDTNELNDLSVIECAINHGDCPLRNLAMC